MPRISNSVRSGDFNEFDDGVKNASGAVCALTESAAQVGCKKTPEPMQIAVKFFRYFSKDEIMLCWCITCVNWRNLTCTFSCFSDFNCVKAGLLELILFLKT